MRTRISRRGKQQVLLGVWIDKIVHDELERTAKGKDMTVADVTRHLLVRAIDAERRRPDAQRLLDGLLNLKEAELTELRGQIEQPRQKRMKKLALSRLRQDKMKTLKKDDALRSRDRKPMPFGQSRST